MTERTDGGVDVAADVEAVVEDTELPRRLKDNVYEVVQDRGASAEEAADIAQAVESRYLSTRVDPLDPVGTVSAQSLGEPGTQMSIPGDERVLIRQHGDVRSVQIGKLVDEILSETETRRIGDHEVGLAPQDLEALSLTTDENTRWKRIEEVSRHGAPDDLLRLRVESGRAITATDNHSFVMQEAGEIVPVDGEELDVGDRLPLLPETSLPPTRAEMPATDGGIRLGTSSPTLESIPAEPVHWERITSIERVEAPTEYVYDLSVAGLETFTTGEGIVTHNTMNTFHYAGVAEFDVTQGLPRLIELVDARKTPDTPTMWVYLEEEYAQERERAHEVVWNIEATRILALGDISTNVADMLVRIDLNEETLAERWPTVEDTDEVVAEIAETIESNLDVETTIEGSVITFGPDRPSYRELLQLVERLRDIVFKGLEEINRVVIKKEEIDGEEEFVLITEGSAYKDVLEIEGVDATRSTCNNIHEIFDTLGIEAAREAIIDETMDTLEEQGLDDVNVRHLMLVADIMTNTGEIQSIGRHGISGSKESVLARAAFEVTVSHLLDAATFGEVDDLNGVTENVIVGKPIKLGTGDVNLRMGAKVPDAESADD